MAVYCCLPKQVKEKAEQYLYQDLFSKINHKRGTTLVTVFAQPDATATHAISWGFYSKAATNQEWHLLNSAEIIYKSFRVCGISVNTDETEDEEIHCLKEGGVAADARESI